MNWLERSKTSIVSQVYNWHPMIVLFDVQIDTLQGEDAQEDYWIRSQRLLYCIPSFRVKTSGLEWTESSEPCFDICKSDLGSSGCVLSEETCSWWSYTSFSRTSVKEAGHRMEGEPVVDENRRQFGFVRRILDPLKPSFESQKGVTQLEGLKIRQRVDILSALYQMCKPGWESSIF